MVLYRIPIDSDQCISCGIAASRCPTNARVLARVLANDRVQTSCNAVEAVFPEELYAAVHRAARGCPVNAIII